MLASIKRIFVLAAAIVHIGQTLPLVDSGLFVILGVSTCRDGTGYCLLGSDCTLDHDFSPDDTGGHCNGLRTAFTPAANFVCCKYNGADVKLPSTTTEAPKTSTLPPLKITTPENKPSRRPVISGGNSKPQSPASNDGGAIFWVDLNSAGGSNNQNTVKFEPSTVYNTNTHPGSSITVSGTPNVDLKVPVSDTPNLENWIKPGVVMNIPGILAAKPGSTVTISGGNELLEEIVQAVGSEVSHGVSITQGDASHHIESPSVQLDTVDETGEAAEAVAPVGSIEGHEPKPQIEILKPVTVATTTTVKPLKPATAATTAKPVAAEETDEEDEESEGEDEDDDEETASEEEEDSEEDDDDGLFGLADLVELLGLDTAQKEGATPVSGKNNTNSIAEDDNDSIESKLGEQSLPNNALLQERVDNKTEEEQTKEPEHLVGGFLSGFGTDSTNASYETSTLPIGGLFASASSPTQPAPMEDEEEEPPLCFGPVREPKHPACWAVSFKSNDARGGTNKNICWGARITKDLVVTSASCAVRISALGLDYVQAFLPASSDNQTEFTINEVIVHEEYHAAPHLALSDIGLVKLNITCSDITEMDMGGCTLCLSQDNKADYSHLSCHTPQIFEEEGVTKAQLTDSIMAQRSACENLTKSGDLEKLQSVFLCSVPSKNIEDKNKSFEGNPLVCTGRRGIPFLAGVRMKSAMKDWNIFTPVSGFVEWIRSNELPQIIKTVTTNNPTIVEHF